MGWVLKRLWEGAAYAVYWAEAKGYIDPEEVQAILPKNLVTSLTPGGT